MKLHSVLRSKDILWYWFCGLSQILQLQEVIINNVC